MNGSILLSIRGRGVISLFLFEFDTDDELGVETGCAIGVETGCELGVDAGSEIGGEIGDETGGETGGETGVVGCAFVDVLTGSSSGWFACLSLAVVDGDADSDE